MVAGKREAMFSARDRTRREGGGRCNVCRRMKDKVHRSRKTKRLVCTTCADRARMRVGACAECGHRKLLQARGRCYACYKRQWRSTRRTEMARPARRAGRRQRTN